MLNAELIETQRSLKKLRKLCRVISFTLIAALVVLSIYWMFAVSSMMFSFANSEAVDIRQKINIPSIVLYLLHGVIIVLLLSIFVRIFANAARGESPFTLEQVKRLRLISGLLLLYAIVDIAISYNTALVQFGTMNYGYVSMNDSAIVTVNFAPVVAAAIVYAFSFVFKYGVLLQEFSDETL